MTVRKESPTRAAKTPRARQPKPLTPQERHERDCKVCHHPRRDEIEAEWIAWEHATKIAKQYRLSRDSLYRHVRALNLFAKRDRNIRAALARIIERSSSVRATAAAVVAAVQAYAKINAQGHWIDRTEHKYVDLRPIFDRMTREELDTYAREGKLPDWFAEFAGATQFESAGGPYGS